MTLSSRKSLTLPMTTTTPNIKKKKKSKKKVKDQEMEEILKAISNFGFPVVIATYLLIRIEGKIETLAESIRSLTQAILSNNDKEDSES